MLKAGDVVAFKSAPDVPIGQVQVSSGCSGVGYVLAANGARLSTFFLGGGFVFSPDRPHRDDVVRFQPPVPERKFWCVWREYGSNPTVKHQTKHGAVNEAIRLAAQTPNSKFYVLEAVEYHMQEASPVKTITLT